MPQYNVDEGSGVQTVCVELTGGTVERRVVLSIASADSNAMGKPGIEYSSMKQICLIEVWEGPRAPHLLVYISF